MFIHKQVMQLIDYIIIEWHFVLVGSLTVSLLFRIILYHQSKCCQEVCSWRRWGSAISQATYDISAVVARLVDKGERCLLRRHKFVRK
jgi:hypothetical protein